MTKVRLVDQSNVTQIRALWQSFAFEAMRCNVASLKYAVIKKIEMLQYIGLRLFKEI